MKNPIRPSHIVVTALFLTVAGAVSSIGGCSWGKGEKSDPETPAPGQPTAKPPVTDGGIPAQPQPTATVTTTATGTAAPGPTLLPPSLCGPGPCERLPGIPSALPGVPNALPPEYFTGNDALASPHCRMTARSHRWHLVGNAYGRDETIVAAMCGRTEFIAFPKDQSYTFQEGALVVSDGKIVSGLTDISPNSKPGTTTHSRHPLLNEEIAGKRLVNVWIVDNKGGAPYPVTLNNPMVVELSSTDGAIQPKDICSKYTGIDNPAKEHPWIQRIWSRCQMAQTPHNVAVIKTMDRTWTEQKDHVALAARVEKLEQLEGKVVKEVKAAGDKEVPVQKIVGFNPAGPN